MARPLPAKQRAILQALRRSHPEPACIGTLARAAWPDRDVPPLLWRETLHSHLTAIRASLDSVTIIRTSLYRYGLALVETHAEPEIPRAPACLGGGALLHASGDPAAHPLQPCQQGSELAQQHGRQQHHQQAIQQRGSRPAADLALSAPLHGPVSIAGTNHGQEPRACLSERHR